MKKNRSFSKRHLILASLVVALAAAVYLNWHFSDTERVSYEFSDTATSSVANLGDAVFVNTSSDQSVTSSENSYFETARNDRSKAREEALDIYKEVINNAKSDKESVVSATDAANRLASDAEKEGDIEALVKSKGFKECVAVISESGVNVIVQSDKLLASDAIQIKDIAAGVTGFETENIKIIEINS